jgi:hypothetical protein
MQSSPWLAVLKWKTKAVLSLFDSYWAVQIRCHYRVLDTKHLFVAFIISITCTAPPSLFILLYSMLSSQIGFHWHNPSGRTVDVGSAQPLTDMTIRGIPWRGRGVKAAGAYGWLFSAIMSRLSGNLGSLNLLEPTGPVQACIEIAASEILRFSRRRLRTLVFQDAKPCTSDTLILVTVKWRLSSSRDTVTCSAADTQDTRQSLAFHIAQDMARH